MERPGGHRQRQDHQDGDQAAADSQALLRIDLRRVRKAAVSPTMLTKMGSAKIPSRIPPPVMRSSFGLIAAVRAAYRHCCCHQPADVWSGVAGGDAAFASDPALRTAEAPSADPFRRQKGTRAAASRISGSTQSFVAELPASGNCNMSCSISLVHRAPDRPRCGWVRPRGAHDREHAPVVVVSVGESEHVVRWSRPFGPHEDLLWRRNNDRLYPATRCPSRLPPQHRR